MTRGMVADDLYAIRWLSDPRFSPDGRQAAFVVTTLSRERDDYQSAIWVVATEGGEPRRWTSGPGKDSAPRWSPIGRALAFLSDRAGGKAQLYLLDAAGGEARQLTNHPAGVANPVWSPDGRRLAVVVREESTAVGEPGKTPPARVITTLQYRANGEGFTYDRRRHIHIVDVVTGEQRQLTEGDWDDREPAWSADGRSLAFLSARHAERDHDRAVDLFVVDAEGGEPRRITPGGGEVAHPAWSPDGASLAYVGYADAEDAPRNSRLWLIPAAGGAPRCLTPDLDRNLDVGDGLLPCWTADGAAIVCALQDRGTVGLLRVTIASGRVERLVEGPLVVSGYDVGAGERLLYLASDPTHPAELFLASGGKAEQLTCLNAGWLGTVSLATPEHFTFAADGHTIDAWVMLPAGEQGAASYPTLLTIHGGPFSQYGWGFFDEFQVQAGAGYAVVSCNPRGSAGQDDAFARAIIGCPAEPDSADVLAALDETLRRYPQLDAGRTGVLGGSYGGYLTSWIVGHTDRFRAACTERSFNNRYSKEGTSDIWSGYTYLRKRQWEDPALYWRYSPIAYVQDIRTPLLIVHSEEDIRCPIEQAEQLYVALKQLRREVRFVRFPGENHELSRTGKPSHRVQRFEHILGWFEEKLAASTA